MDHSTPKSNDGLRLSDLATLYRSGKTDVSVSTVSIDLRDLNSEQISCLLEVVAKTQFGIKRISDMLRRKDLETLDSHQVLRQKIFAGQFESALKSVTESESDPEVLIQKVRCQHAMRDFESSKVLARLIIDNRETIVPTRGVALQLLGDSCLELGEFAASLDYQKQSLEIALGVGNLSGQFSSHLFLTKHHAFLENHAMSDYHLDQAFQILSKKSNLRWVIGYFRTKGIAYFSRDFQKSQSAFLMALYVCQYLGDMTYLSRSVNNLSQLIENNIGEGSVPSSLLEVSTEIRPEAEMNQNIENHRPIQSATHFQKKAPKETKKNVLTSDLDEILKSSFRPWIIDRDSGTLIQSGKGSVHFLCPGSRLAKLAENLNRVTLISKSELFEKVWHLKWNPVRHENTLKVSIARLRQILPRNSIKADGESIRCHLNGHIV